MNNFELPEGKFKIQMQKPSFLPPQTWVPVPAVGLLYCTPRVGRQLWQLIATYDMRIRKSCNGEERVYGHNKRAWRRIDNNRVIDLY